jgi:putative endonuclease
MRPERDQSRASRPPAGLDGARRGLGDRGEQLARAHVRRRGYTVLARNVRTRHGEVDLIARDGPTLVFVEVKTRRAGDRGTIRADQDPLLGLGPAQRRRLRRLAAAWLADRSGPRPRASAIRFDVIAVVVDTRGRTRRLEHIEGAF